MAYARTASVKALIAKLPAALEKNILRGAARAAATVVADEAKERVISDEVRASIKITTSARDGKITAKVQTKGPGAYLAPWLEYGTDPHFITVSDADRGGRSIKRFNKEVREGSLVIGGHFVGPTVRHPGARPHPFLRPALDTKEADAIKAAQSYITTRLAAVGPFAAPEPEPNA
jgi:hypothetical protein